MTSVVATLAITQVYGIAIPHLSRPQALGPAAPGVTATSEAWTALEDPHLGRTATRIVAAAASDPAPATTRPVYIDATTASMNTLQQTQWFLALPLRWTETINAETTPLGFTNDPVRAIRITGDIMRRDPRIVLLTPPASFDVVRSVLAEPSLDPRVLAAPPSRNTGP
jgi:hypothetical protein